MAFLVLLVFACLVMVASLRRRVTELERRQEKQLERLLIRVAALEANAPHTVSVALPPVAPDIQPAPRSIERPAPTPRPEPAAAPPAAVAPLPVVSTQSRNAWEVEVGSNWLNKIGVLVFVIGVALLVGYSMTHVGPAGRVAMGYLLSLAMLGAGMAFERRPRYVNYGYGLIAGGWAGTYFTTYAMHALDSARIVSSDVVATLALVVVAGGMIGHSLKYRSQTVTALAYLVAYATLALTPLSGFALAAALPLAVSVLVVAHRFSWQRVAALGVVSTYGLFALRGQVFPGGVTNASPVLPFAALAAYWITFEAFDLMGIRKARSADTRQTSSLFALNAIGYLGAGILQLPFTGNTVMFEFLSLSGTAYLISAVVRARFLRVDSSAERQTPLKLGSAQSAVALSASLVAWAIDVRFSGVRETAALLMETEMLVVAGVVLGDRWIRLMASAGIFVASLHALSLVGHSNGVSWLLGWRYWSPAIVATAICWYSNREFLRVCRITPEALEWLYTPAASSLMAVALFWEAGSHFATALFVFGAALLAIGLLVERSYRFQGYAAGIIGAMLLIVQYLGPLPLSKPQALRALLIASVVSYASSIALVKVADARMSRTDQRPAAAIAWWLGSVFLVGAESLTLDRGLVAPAWALTAFVHLLIGRFVRAFPIRLHAYVLMLVAIARATQTVLLIDDGSSSATFWASVVIAIAYIATIVGRPALEKGGEAGALEGPLRIVGSLAASLAVSVLIAHDVRPTAMTLALGLQGAALLGAGFPLRERVLRLSGLTLLLFCILKLFVHDLAALEALARIFSFVVLGLVLLAVSWTYTRFREQIRKLL